MSTYEGDDVTVLTGANPYPEPEPAIFLGRNMGGYPVVKVKSSGIILVSTDDRVRWPMVTPDKVVTNSFPREISFEDIKVGDRIEVTFDDTGSVAVGTVYVKNTSSRCFTLKFSKHVGLLTVDARHVTFRLLSQPKPEIKVGDAITRDLYTELPAGSIITDDRLGEVVIAPAMGSPNGIRVLKPANSVSTRCWRTLTDNGTLGKVKYINRA